MHGDEAQLGEAIAQPEEVRIAAQALEPLHHLVAALLLVIGKHRRRRARHQKGMLVARQKRDRNVVPAESHSLEVPHEGWQFGRIAGRPDDRGGPFERHRMAHRLEVGDEDDAADVGGNHVVGAVVARQVKAKEIAIRGRSGLGELGVGACRHPLRRMGRNVLAGRQPMNQIAEAAPTADRDLFGLRSEEPA